MPLGRYPGRVKDFRKWATEKVDQAALTDSATPHVNKVSRGKRRRRNRWKRRKKKHATQD